jgi:hypothetical protein
MYTEDTLTLSEVERLIGPRRKKSCISVQMLQASLAKEIRAQYCGTELRQT